MFPIEWKSYDHIVCRCLLSSVHFNTVGWDPNRYVIIIRLRWQYSEEKPKNTIYGFVEIETYVCFPLLKYRWRAGMNSDESLK